MDRREFVGLLSKASVAGMLPGVSGWAMAGEKLQPPMFGNTRILHFTDCHAQLLPVYFREPNVNLGIGPAYGKLPHIVGKNLLKKIPEIKSLREAHAYTYLDFTAAAEKFGKVGGFAHLKTLIDQCRGEAGDGRSILIDGGDTWQGSGTALWTRGKDMVEACNMLGVDVMTGHWEFTYQDNEILENAKLFNGEFVAQNIKASEDALFEGIEVYDEDSGHVFKPYVIREMQGKRVAVIGQAFPYTPIANPKRFIPDWTFGIQEGDLQELVDDIRSSEKPDAVLLLSHNGMDVDLKLASRVSGIDAIMGGHTHDGMPVPVVVENPGGKTLVTNAGSNGKYLAVLDLDLGNGKVNGFKYSLLPVFSNIIPADAAMTAYIAKVRQPYNAKLNEKLATAENLLYRRGNFNGTFDQVICDSLTNVLDAQFSFSPGFRWGTSVLPGEAITMDRLLDQTCMTYPETYVRDMKGEQIKAILEDVCDNLFNQDPYRQQGGDMVRVGGLTYICEPNGASLNRISDIRDLSGNLIDANKGYKVAGWATVGSKSPGEPIWDVVATYLRDKKTIKVEKLIEPKLKGVAGNPGLADYQGEIV
ncbi:MAG: thiosulfohydrolase SoxB [Xanthomonadales bacterium]|nr:thiosulfohydrolase SoxB [Xanthomonadales bacterium]